MKAMIESIQLNTLQRRLFLSLVFALIFVLLGTFAPPFLIKTLPVQYYNLEMPIGTNLKLYAPGDTVKLSALQDSKLDTTIRIDLNLTLINADTKKPVETYHVSDFPVNKGIQLYEAELQLPDQIPSGTYLYSGVITYYVQNIKKELFFYTGQFEVRQEKVVPDN